VAKEEPGDAAKIAVSMGISGGIGGIRGIKQKIRL
jgi:hypothetical protein